MFHVAASGGTHCTPCWPRCVCARAPVTARHDAVLAGVCVCVRARARALADAAGRISADVDETVAGFAKCFSDALFASTAGVIYSVQIGRLFGWRFALAPYAYLGCTYVLIEKVL
eukprot:COSAG01_NODE_39221_length_479_cov_1.228947_1_plen_114_part_10